MAKGEKTKSQQERKIKTVKNTYYIPAITALRLLTICSLNDMNAARTRVTERKKLCKEGGEEAQNDMKQTWPQTSEMPSTRLCSWVYVIKSPR